MGDREWVVAGKVSLVVRKMVTAAGGGVGSGQEGSTPRHVTL